MTQKYPIGPKLPMDPMVTDDSRLASVNGI